MEAQRIPPEEARNRVENGEAVLVCGYEDEEKCRGMHLQGSMTLQEFEATLPSLDEEQEIVFYCA